MTTPAFRVLITRSHEGNAKLGDKLLRIGCQPIPLDTISLDQPGDWRPVDAALRSLSGFDWVVFTSPRGVTSFLQRMRILGLPMPREGRPRFAAVGPSTARELSQSGLHVSFVPQTFLTASLGEGLPEDAGRRVLLLRTDIANPGLSETLKSRGFQLEERPIYRTGLSQSKSEEIPEPDAVVFASPSAVKGLCHAVGETQLRKLRTKRTFCIGPVTADAARESGFVKVVTPSVHTVDALVDEIGKRMAER